MGNFSKKDKYQKEESEFEQKLVEVARVTRVMAGGKRMRFRATLAIGDRKGRVGVGVAKGADVTMAIKKAFNQAKKNLVRVPMLDGTVPHEILSKFKSAQVLIKPAKKGSGVKAGGAARMILELAGLEDVTAKILGSNNKINNVKAVLVALEGLKMPKKKEETAEVKKEVKLKPKKEDNKETVTS